MGIAYKIRCQHCNTEFDYCEDQSFGMLPRCVGCESYVEMERPIRCPACHKRLNTSQEEFDAYIKTMQIHGLGGTDFRPVFSYVDWLREKKEFQNLKGLIYFTDGFGTFPEQMPDYETAFVFLDEELNNYDVPPWAMKLILRKDEI